MSEQKSDYTDFCPQLYVCSFLLKPTVPVRLMGIYIVNRRLSTLISDNYWVTIKMSIMYVYLYTNICSFLFVV